MRTGTTLRREPPDGLEPLGAFNQPVYRGFAPIRAALMKDLGPQYADYFTKPDFDGDGKRIGWVANAEGVPRRWVELGPGEQSDLEPRKRELYEGFRAYINRLKAEPENSSRNNFSRVLEQALQAPDEGHLYFIDQQPMVTFWGFKHEGEPCGIDPLMPEPSAALIDAPDLPSASKGIGAVAADRGLSSDQKLIRGASTQHLESRRQEWWRWEWWRWHWWDWWQWGELGSGVATWTRPLWIFGTLLLFLLLLTFLWWLFAPRPGVSPPSYWLWPFQEHTVSVSPAPVPELSTSAPEPPIGLDGAGAVTRLPASGNGSETGIRLNENSDPSPMLSSPLSTAPDPSQPQSRPSHSTVAPDHPPPGIVRPPGPAQVPAIRGTPLTLPSGNLSEGPAAFMQGLWHSQAGLRDAQGNPLEQYYRFDAHGQGDVRVRTPNGRECRGDAQALVQPGGRLEIREDPMLACSDGTSLSGASTLCVNGSDNNAGCEGTNARDGSKYKVQMEQMSEK